MSIYNHILAPINWCSVTYYEYDKKVGEIFTVNNIVKQLFIDGGLDAAATNRFCLGSVTNVERNDACDRCRQVYFRS